MANDVLNRIETATEDKVELSDDEMEALGIWAANPAHIDRRPTIKSNMDTQPISWAIFDVSDVAGRERGELLALEIHSNLMGDRRSRPYALGVGKPEIDLTSLPDSETMTEDVHRVATNQNVTPPTSKQVADIRAEMAMADVDFLAEVVHGGNAWATAFNGTKIFAESEDTRWRGFDVVFDEAGLTDEQIRVIMEASKNWRTSPRNVDGSYSTAGTITFPN